MRCDCVTSPVPVSNISFALALLLSLTVLLASSCDTNDKPGRTAVYTYSIVNSYPHDRGAFTQGLVFSDGVLFEGTGLKGRSTLRKVDLQTAKVLKIHKLPARYFGEGITIVADKIIQLTLDSNVGFVYDRDSFKLLRTFKYPTKGWGITYDGTNLIMSDGSATLYLLDAESFEQRGRIEVRDGDTPIAGLNELEYVRGRIYANIWTTDRIVIISPQTGRVTGRLDLTGLLGFKDRLKPVNVLNGIAYDAEQRRLFVTGKLWPKLFEIKLIRKK